MSIAFNNTMHHGSHGKLRIAAMVQLPDGFDLVTLPGVQDAKGADELPTLSRTIISVANFDGETYMSTPDRKRYKQHFRNQVGITSACLVSATGPLGSILGAKQLNASLHGWLQFTDGSFGIYVDTEGTVKVTAGGFKVEAQDVALKMERTPWARERLPSAGSHGTGDSLYYPSWYDAEGGHRAVTLLQTVAAVQVLHKDILVGLRANGTVHLPEQLGVMHIPIDGSYYHGELSLSAMVEAPLFSTKVVITLGVVRYPDQLGKRTKVMLMLDMPDGFCLEHLPGFGNVYGIQKVPCLAKGARIAWSNYNGPAGLTTLNFLTSLVDMLDADFDEFVNQLTPKLQDVVMYAGQDVIAAKEAVHALTQLLQTIVPHEGHATAALTGDQGPAGHIEAASKTFAKVDAMYPSAHPNPNPNPNPRWRPCIPHPSACRSSRRRHLQQWKRPGGA